jgi:hypothetical protein
MIQFDAVPPATGEWECMECGYIEDGIRARRPQICPECGAPVEAFDFFSYDGSEKEDRDSDLLTGDEYEEDAYDANFEDKDAY